MTKKKGRQHFVDLDADTKGQLIAQDVIDTTAQYVNTLKGRRAKEDFWYFVHEVWGPKHPGYMKLTDDCHKRMARHLQDCIMEWEWLCQAVERGETEGYIVRYAQEAARGLGKSLLGTIAGSAWTALRNPDAALVIDTRTERLGIAFLAPIAAVMRGADATSRFCEFYGNWHSNNRVWDKTMFTHAERKNMSQIEASFELSANTISQTSHHPSGVFTDDPINEDDVSEAQLDQALRHNKSWVNIIRVPGFHFYSGTPYVKGDVIHNMKETQSGGERGSWQWLRIPAIEKDAHGNEYSVAPKIRPLEWLKKKREEDPVNFAAQFMLSPGEGEHQPLTMAQCLELEINPVDVPTTGFAAIHVDAAWADERSSARGDSTVIAVSWQSPNFATITKLWVKERCKQEDYFRALATILRELGEGVRRPLFITMDAETGGYGGSVRRIHEIECANRGVWLPKMLFVNRQQKGPKYRRIILAAGRWASGAVRIMRGIEHKHELYFQMTRIMASGHDDIADACADMFHPEIQRMQLFGNKAKLWEKDEQEVVESGVWVPPLPSHMDAPVVPASPSMESPRHEPDFVAEILSEISRDKEW